MIPVATKRRKPSKLLSVADSLRFAKSVLEYLPRNAYYRTKKLSDIMGCSWRTASRIINGDPVDFPRIKKLYLQTAAAKLNVPASKLLSRQLPPPGVERLNNIDSNVDLPIIDRYREVAAVATSMAARCMFGFDMAASYHVEHNSTFEPMYIHLRFRKKSCTAVHEIEISRDHNRKWRMIYNHEKFGPRFNGDLSDDNLDRILNFAKEHTK